MIVGAQVALADFLSCVSYILTGETYIIPARRQMIVVGTLTIDGTLVVDGTLVLL